MNKKNENRNFVSKGWGYEDWIANSELYCGKVLFLKKDKHLSLHYHNLKDETFYIQSGKVCFTYYGPGADWRDNEFVKSGWNEHILPWPEHLMANKQGWGDLHQIILEQGDSFHISVGMRHTAYGLLDSHIFEFSTQHFDSDSIRILKGS